MYREWNNAKLRFIVMLVIMCASAVAIVALKSFVVSLLNSPQIQAYLKAYSGKISQMLELLSNNFSYYSFTQWFGKNYQQLAALTAIIFSFSLFSKEFERKTIYLLTSRMTRWQVYSSKLFTGYILLSIVVFGGGMIYEFTAKLYAYDLAFGMAMTWTITTLIGSLLLYQIGAYTSMIFKDQVKPFLVDVLIYIALYISGIFKPTKFLGLFSYMASVDVFQGKSIDILGSVVVILISLFIFIGGYYQFKRMEF